jgi:hypothetical protein
VLRWGPAVDSHSSAKKAANIGAFAALGFAAWIGVPAVLWVTLHLDKVNAGVISPVDLAIRAVLAGFALFTASRFRVHRGWIVGPILLVALVIEVTKRIVLTLEGTLSFGVVTAVVPLMLFFGLLIGVRGARALRHRPLNDNLGQIFE